MHRPWAIYAQTDKFPAPMQVARFLRLEDAEREAERIKKDVEGKVKIKLEVRKVKDVWSGDDRK